MAYTLRSPRNLMETADAPTLRRGGPSDSDQLNRIFRNVLADVGRLERGSQDQSRRQQLLTVMLAQQAFGIQGVAAHLLSLLPAAPARRGLVDFYGASGIAGGNTAQIDADYGQATLPVLSVQEKMHGVDLAGEIWVPEDSRLRFLAVPAAGWTAGTIPDDDLFLSSPEDYLGIGPAPDSFFLGGELSVASILYLKAVLPQTLTQHRLANRVTLFPLPAMAHTLIGAYYRTTDGVWHAIDFSYLPGYQVVSGEGQVPFLGPFRLHFPPAEVTQVCAVLRADGWWGVAEAGVQLAEYGPAAALVVDFSAYSPGAIQTVTPLGKDPGVLTGYAQSVSGSQVTLALTQASAYITPVVTGVIADW